MSNVNPFQPCSMKLRAEDAMESTVAVTFQIPMDLGEKVNQTIVGRNCTKGEFIAGMLDTAMERGLADKVLGAIEETKRRESEGLTRSEVLRRLRRLDQQRAVLAARLKVIEAVPAPPHDARKAKPDELSAREVEVVRLVAMGSNNGQMAETLQLSEHTVSTHLKRIYKKLGVNSRMTCVEKARRLWLIP